MDGFVTALHTERHFAEKGYAATNLRAIAQDADVTQAMINYWFGSKIDMFKEVYLRRGQWLSTKRIELLDEVKAQPKRSIEDVLRAYLSPSFELRETVQGRSFLRLQARLHAETDDIAYELRQEVYDLPVRLYVEILSDLVPKLSESELYIRFAQFIGIYLYILSDAHRIDKISSKKSQVPSSRQMVDEVVRFAAAGFNA